MPDITISKANKSQPSGTSAPHLYSILVTGTIKTIMNKQADKMENPFLESASRPEKNKKIIRQTIGEKPLLPLSGPRVKKLYATTEKIIKVKTDMLRRRIFNIYSLRFLSSFFDLGAIKKRKSWAPAFFRNWIVFAIYLIMFREEPSPFLPSPKDHEDQSG